MTAEEMFIKLGFTKKITPNTFIMYGCVLLPYEFLLEQNFKQILQI